MTLDTYKLTSTEEPSDELLSQLMKEAFDDARKADAENDNYIQNPSP